MTYLERKEGYRQERIKKNEVWKPVKNYDGIYEVSNLGNVKSLDRIEFVSGVNYFRKRKGRLLKPRLHRDGYIKCCLLKNGRSRTRMVHQLVAEVFLNHIPNGHKLVVNHINFIRADNRLENLEIVTQRENANLKHIRSSSKYVGVNYNSRLKKWGSRITISKNTVYLGTFDTELEASKYYENALIAIKNNEEIQIKKFEYTSKYKGVCYNKKAKKWVAGIKINGKYKYLGLFTNELCASKVYQEELKNKNYEKICGSIV